jgi:hypothetical protein
MNATTRHVHRASVVGVDLAKRVFQLMMADIRLQAISFIPDLLFSLLAYWGNPYRKG